MARSRRLLQSLAASFALVLLALPARAAEVTVKISVDTSGDSTRVVLSHSAPAKFSVDAAVGRVTVRWVDPVTVEPPTARYSDDMLARHEQTDSRTLVLETGKSYTSYEDFELRNPLRLVLDLEGKRAASRAAAPSRSRDSGLVVVLDPGHGGAEHGAVGPTGLEEKELTLDLARRVAAELRSEKKLTIVLTRDEDRLVGLDERTAIANHNRADLFVSLHANASRRPGATGAETYYLATEATDDEARTVAALENRAHGVEPGELAGEAAGAQDALELILWDLAQNQYLVASSRLAERVQRQLNELAGTRDRGVRQAPFRVLMGATMPAILVEVGFVSSAEEETKLKSTEYRNRLATAIGRAIREFLAELEREQRNR